MTQIRLTNTATRRKEDFTPLDAQNVRMYLCGPTVYDRAHLGNARPVVMFDVLFRLLRHVYGPEHVTYVRNYTDIDDKIIARAAETGRPIDEITTETTAWYEDDMIEGLGTLRPTHQPRATAYVPQMIAMIETLMGKGHASAAEGHVLFKVGSYEAYGALSGRSVDDMIAGARVEVAPYKEDPMDFVLWKPSEPGHPGWDSPWGRGRPGWHIECSAMARDLLGDAFDIHGGGLDLQFPHHENEIAQSKCACDGGFASVWLHNEMLQVEGKKMSKSLGNFFTVRDLLDQGVPGEVIRFVLLSTHYSKPMDWTAEKARQATQTLRRWATLTEGIEPSASVASTVVDALRDDLNTHAAIDATKKTEADPAALLASAQFLGFLRSAHRAPVQQGRETDGDLLLTGDEDVLKMVYAVIRERRDARARSDFARADLIRDVLVAAGVEVKDRPDGVEWTLDPDFDQKKLEALKGRAPLPMSKSIPAGGSRRQPTGTEVANEPRTPLPLRHHIARWAADAGRRLQPGRQDPINGGARCVGARLHRGRLARRQPDRQCLFRPSAPDTRDLYSVRDDQALGAVGGER